LFSLSSSSQGGRVSISAACLTYMFLQNLNDCLYSIYVHFAEEKYG
jgi:hypothetical protein